AVMPQCWHHQRVEGVEDASNAAFISVCKVRGYLNARTISVCKVWGWYILQIAAHTDGSSGFTTHSDLKLDSRETWRNKGAGILSASALLTRLARMGILRLPASKAACELALHALAGVLAPGAPMYVGGYMDEGMLAAFALLEPLFESPQWMCRPSEKYGVGVILAQRAAAGTARKLSSFRNICEVDLEGQSLPWLVYPGLFAGGCLDIMTGVLLKALPTPPPEAQVLDFCSGSGVIAAGLRARQRTLELHLLDADVLALRAAAKNLPEARCHLSDGWCSLLEASAAEPASCLRFHWIVSNPPVHCGLQDDFSVIEEMLEHAPRFLHPGGALYFVTQQYVPVWRLQDRGILNEKGISSAAAVHLEFTDGRFSVWKVDSLTSLKVLAMKGGGEGEQRASTEQEAKRHASQDECALFVQNKRTKRKIVECLD
ncbi:hypothetical protein CYMTET_7514, partial [Cymbomonas tetramitiformis]